MTREQFLMEIEDIANDPQTEEDVAFLKERAHELKEHDEVVYQKFLAMVNAIEDFQTYAKTLIGTTHQTLN